MRLISKTAAIAVLSFLVASPFPASSGVASGELVVTPSSGKAGEVIVLRSSKNESIFTPSNMIDYEDSTGRVVLSQNLSSDSEYILTTTIPNLPPGRYDIFFKNGYGEVYLYFGLLISVSTGGTGVNFAIESWTQNDPHPSGTLINQDGTVYLIGPTSASKAAFPNPEVFYSYGYSFSEVVPASAGDRALPTYPYGLITFADGSLIVDAGTVYIIDGGWKYGFTSRETFEGLGFKFSNVWLADLSSYRQVDPPGGAITDSKSAHTHGELININGAIFKFGIGGRKLIPSMNVFRANKFKLEEVVPANTADLFLDEGVPYGFPDGTIVNLNGGLYYIEDGLKRPFHNANVFLALGYKFSLAIKVTEQELAGYPDGVAFE